MPKPITYKYYQVEYLAVDGNYWPVGEDEGSAEWFCWSIEDARTKQKEWVRSKNPTRIVKVTEVKTKTIVK